MSVTEVRMGRPPLPENQRRDKPLRIRLTDEEREKIDAAAEQAGYSSSSGWARDLLVESAEKELFSKRRKRS